MLLGSETTEEDPAVRAQPDYLFRVAQASAAPSSLAEGLVLMIHATLLEGGLKLEDQASMSVSIRVR